MTLVWVSHAAANGSQNDETKALSSLGEREKAQLIQRLQVSAADGDAGSQFSLGTAYDSGYGVEADPGKAAFWYRQAAENGHIDAQFNIAVLYEEGVGVPQNMDLARYWYEAAANRGSIMAQSNLGRLLASSEPPDYTAARLWFERAAAAGHVEATYNLALVHLHGLGTASNPAKARELLVRVRNAYPPAQEALDRMNLH